jgi:hypothetical protein
VAKGTEATIEERVALMLMSRGLPIKPCGLNADWSVAAWHLDWGEPNTTDGDFYLLDTEETDEHGEPLFEVVQRFYGVDDEESVKPVEGQSPGRLAEAVNKWLFSDARKGRVGR